jgi:cellulose synthase/poly-beta-1,6-N-acetylglucosamine synthase-like glycosyltransferase
MMQNSFNLLNINSESSATKNESVSVVIPLYNHERYVAECLDSVLAQDMPNIELLLLDDGSSDKGFDVACRWKEAHDQSRHRVALGGEYGCAP